MSFTDITQFLPKNEYDAAVNAASPSAANPFATMADIGANNEWSEILANGNTSGANNVIINQPQLLIFEGGAFGSNNNHFIARGSGGLGAEDEFWVTGDKSIHLRIRNTTNDSQAYLDRFGGWYSVDETGSETIGIVPKGQRINFVSSSGSLSNSNIDASGMTGNRLWTLPDASGTIALTTDYTLANVLSNGNTTGANDISINSGQNLVMGDGFSNPASKVYWSANHYINYDEYVDDVLLINSTSGIEMRTSAHSASWTGATGMLFSGFGTGSYLLPGATTAQRTWTLPDATGTIALTTDSLATSSNLQTVLTNGNATGTQDIVFSDGRYAKFSDGGSFYVNVKGPASVTTSDKTVLFQDASGTVALTSDLSGYLPLTGGTLTGELGVGDTATSSYTINAKTGAGGNTAAVFGWQQGSATQGVYGYASGASGKGVYGHAVGTSNPVGVQGAAISNGKITGIGGSFSTTGTGTTNIGIRVSASGATNNWAIDVTGGGILFADGVHFTIGQTTGTKFGTSTNDKIGFFDATPIIQPTAITQTYSTTSATHAARTAATLTDSSGGTANTTVAAVSGSGADATINDNFADITAQINNLITDQQNTAQVVNLFLDKIQSLGLIA